MKEQRRKIELLVQRMVPVGINGKTELRWLSGTIAAGILFSTGFIRDYLSHYEDLFMGQKPNRILMEGAMMTDFEYLIRGRLTGFVLVALFMLAISVYHYLYHFQGSRSVYLMKRLPDRWEFLRRCIALPLFGIFLSIVTAALLFGVYYLIYMAFTPKTCLEPGQLRKVWSGWSGF